MLAKVEEECKELEDALDAGRAPAVEEELGDLLFSLAQFARHTGIDPEAALRSANAKFERRFRRMEAIVADSGRDLESIPQTEKDRIWEAVKSEERQAH
mgnify:CR=1 FL=1